MAIEKTPKSPVPRGYIPPLSRSYKVKDGDTWVSIARKNSLDTWDLIEFNFKTRDPDEVNWYLRRFVGCKKQTRDGKNWIFGSGDDPGIIYIPLTVTVIDMDETVVEGEVFCKETPTENYPYSDDTFVVIAGLADTIKDFSRRYDVPPIAVAGSIADEYNTRTGVRSAVDWFQDRVLLNYMPNFFIEVDAWAGFNTKLLNSTKHDIGIGNIKLETAKLIYEQYKYTFQKNDMDYSDLVDYILTDQGTVHVAALVIKKAREELDSYLEDYPDEVKEAVYVTYYKQGPSYLQRFLKARETDPDRRLKPGEGCRVFRQRDRFAKILKVD
jgi:hypothetical protein